MLQSIKSVKRTLFFAFSFLLMTLLLFSVAVKASAYTDNEDGYTFDLPSDWSAMGDSVFEQYTSAGQASGVVYEKGFSKSGTVPYLLLQEYNSDSQMYVSIMDEVYEKGLYNEEIPVNGNHATVAAEATMMSPIVNREDNILYMSMDISGVKALMALMIGEDIAVQINFYTTEDLYDRDVEDFNSIVNSFEFKKPYNSGSSTDSDDDDEDDNAMLRNVLIGAGAGAVAGGAFVFLKKGKKEESPKKSDKK